MLGTDTISVENPSNYSYDLRMRRGLTITSSISLFCSILCVLTFFGLFIYNARRINIPLVKITMVIQVVNTISLVIIIILNDVLITSEVLCSTLRYVLYTCYLCSIFMCTAITIHLWLVISRRNLDQATRGQRWYYIVSFVLALTLSAILGIIPNSAYKIKNRCFGSLVPSKEYLLIRWMLYYGWFVVASIISFLCMAGVLISARRLTHTTNIRRGPATGSTEAYRNQINARANNKRLRSLVFYTITYPVISFACNILQLVDELLSTVTKKQLKWLVFASRIMLYSQGFFLALAFFCYPAVRHSFRDITHSSIQYWVCEQEEYWNTLKTERKMREAGAKGKERVRMPVGERDAKNFISWRGRLYHFVLKRTPEGRLLSNL